MATTARIHPPAKGGLPRARVRRGRWLRNGQRRESAAGALARARARRRRWLRWLRWVGAAGFLLSGVVFYGWRYGFSPLPEPLGGSPETNDLFWEGAANPASNFWQVLRAVAPGVPPCPLSKTTWLSSTLQSSTAPRERQQVTEEWEAWQQAIRHARRVVLSAPDRRPPRALQQEDANALRLLSVSLDSVPPFSDSVVDWEGEFQRLLARWRLEAAVVPASEFPSFFDERGVLHAFDILAKPTQTSLLRVDRLDPEQGATLLREFASVTNCLGSVEASFLRQVVRAEDDQRRQWTPRWRSVRQSFGMAVTLMVRDAGNLLEDLWQQGLGRHWGGGPNYRGAAHFLRPLEQLALALQLWVTRPRDLERIREASVSRTVAALRSRTLPPRESRPDWFPGNPSRRPWWRRVLDRPAVWRSIEALPDPYTLDAGRRHWLQYLESCRLTLALRLFRDQHGAWPDRLEELVPAVMSNLPVDPVTGEPFRYVRTGNRWRLKDPYGAVLAETGDGFRPPRR